MLKRYKTALWYILVGLTSMLAGAVLHMGYDVYMARPDSVGGEVLLLPLMALLVTVGFQLRGMIADTSAYRHGWEDGYNESKIDGAIRFYAVQEKHEEQSHDGR